MNTTLPNKNSKITNNSMYLKLAVPLIISGVSTPILGAVDTAVVGRMTDPSYIGGVAIGTVIFNTMYWLLGFLRVSTSGFTAQAEGANNEKEIVLSLLRPMIIAILCGLLFILFQKPILNISLTLMGGSDAVLSSAETYFSIRIWGAPFILLSYTIIGWLIGLGKVGLSLTTQIAMNLLNIVLDILFVLVFNMGVAGVAYATVISEISVILTAIIFVIFHQRARIKAISFHLLLDRRSLVHMFQVNRDLFLRTICLLTMTFTFTSISASMGESILAANAIMLQIQYIMAYFFGGFANASSILVGRAIGKKHIDTYKLAFTYSAKWGLFSAFLMSLTIFLFGNHILNFFTTIEEVQAIASQLLIWMIIFPFTGFWGLQLEGIFSGATEATAIRNSILLALLVFFITMAIFIPSYSYHGVWLAFVLFSLSRSFFLSLSIKKLTKNTFPQKTSTLVN